MQRHNIRFAPWRPCGDDLCDGISGYGTHGAHTRTPLLPNTPTSGPYLYPHWLSDNLQPLMKRIDDVQPLLDGIIHWDTQQASHGAHLTVDQVFRLTGPGQLDFGGSEFAGAPREQVYPKKAAPDDSYGWWRLDAGAYVVRYNETLQLEAGQQARLSPLVRLLQVGAHHPTCMLDPTDGPLELLLMVGSAGCHLKENSRITRVEVFAAP